MDAGTWVGLLGGGAGGITALWSGVREIIVQRHKHKQENTATALAAWKEIVNRQEAERKEILERQQVEVDLLKRQIVEQQQAMGLLFDANSQCETRLAEWYEWMAGVHRAALAQGADLPALPPRQARRNLIDELEFRRRTTEQNTTLIKNQFATPVSSLPHPAPTPTPAPTPPGDST